MGKFYITTAIDYVNSRPHVGHALEKIGADVMARYRRLLGDNVTFLTGTDEHSTNVEREARKQGLEPQTYCDQMEQNFRAAWKSLSVSHDLFIRTTDARHVAAARELFSRIEKAGDIYKGKYAGQYCVGCEAWKRDSDLQNGRCPNHPTSKLEWIEEENLFFRLSRYRDAILQRLQKNPGWIEPEIRRNEMLRLLEEGLEDISISRKNIGWGVPIPNHEGYVLYVWFDALISYISAIGFGADPERFARLWPADVHVIGKDITRFHCVIWPAMLLSAGIEPAKNVFVHGFVYLKDGKMSKSEGRVIDPMEVANRYGSDALRYFLMRDIAFDNDGEFSWDKFTQRYNSDLANDLGNLVQRTLHMIQKYHEGTIPPHGVSLPQDDPLKSAILSLPERIRPFMDRWQYHLALAEIWKAVNATNTYLEVTAPWTKSKEGKTDAVAASLAHAAEALRLLTLLLSPFLPETADQCWKRLGLEAKPTTSHLDEAYRWDYRAAGRRVDKGLALFPRIEDTPKTNE